MMETILVHAIDGTSVWVPVIAKRLNDSYYRIEASDHFDASDSSFLLEFIPGDVVELGSRQFTNGERHMVAVGLVSPSNMNFKDYFEFQFNCVQGMMKITKEQQNKYRHVIERIDQESLSGKFFYPKVLEEIKAIKNL